MYHTKTSHESLSCNSKLQSMKLAFTIKLYECILTMQFCFHVPFFILNNDCKSIHCRVQQQT